MIRSDLALAFVVVIVHDLRMPRTMLGVCVGVALGLAGALTRNPPP
ncbi:hypothetical protein GCM10027598_48010 [Amycolatopsis oliviviridis]|uniref:Uncharacterized protein n=1 Tax=Amycolatopsis oliviviridis TaxID=1471590 RepID=A0ABQ3MBS0_9PSEU|nr:hypothetical protein [Amycolatopsis oliviviridis]GHH37849.1 hypothetical protein GCM10017790_82850 [Amycolatopsis oliviviridis]